VSGGKHAPSKARWESPSKEVKRGDLSRERQGKKVRPRRGTILRGWGYESWRIKKKTY